MKGPRGVIPVAFVCLLGLGIWTISRNRPLPAASVPQPVASGHVRPPLKTADDEDDFAAREKADREVILRDWEELQRWLHRVPPPSPEEVRTRLKILRNRWAALDPQVLAETLRQLLDTHADAPTGLAFQVGVHGSLEGWPTLRVFLLDVLAVSDPAAAAEIARMTLEKTSSADEYAVAMRSLTHPGPVRANDKELLDRFGVMLAHAGWETQPGFAEAFDLPRAIGSVDAARTLAAWQGNGTLRRMALEEFAADHPAAMVAALASAEGAALDGSIKADLMARIDPVDPAQLAAADAYLRNPELPAEEAAGFLKTFPLRSATTGDRLYGEAPAPYTHDGIAAGDRAALEQVNRWLADPEMQRYRADLEPLQARLATWVDQAGAR